MTYTAKAQPRLGIDFDGVIYPGGAFKNILSFDQAPRPGVITWLENVSTHFEILVWTSRLCQEDHPHYENNQAMSDAFEFCLKGWLLEHGMPAHILKSRVQVIPPGVGKPSCDVYIDDHGYRYEGGSYPTVGDLINLNEQIYWKVQQRSAGEPLVEDEPPTRTPTTEAGVLHLNDQAIAALNHLGVMWNVKAGRWEAPDLPQHHRDLAEQYVKNLSCPATRTKILYGVGAHLLDLVTQEGDPVEVPLRDMSKYS